MKCLRDLTDSEKGFLQLLLDNIANGMQNYNVEMKDLDLLIRGDFNFSVNFLNERSLAYYCTNIIDEQMKLSFSDVITLNEAAINMSNTLSASESKSILDLIENNIKGTLTKRKLMYPDALVKFTFDYNNAYVFIEYKVNSSFKYFDLASDLIKYLIYTTGSNEKSYFMYIVFNHGNFATMKPTGNVVYQILQNSIRKSSVNFDANVFLYDICNPQNETNRAEGDKEDLIDRFKAISKITDVILRIEKLGLSEQDVLASDNFDENEYYKNRDGFAHHVIIANIIKNNFHIIKGVYNHILKNQIDISLNPDSAITMYEFYQEQVESPTDFVKETISYFNNQINYHLKEGKDTLNGSTYNVNYKRANWILSLVIQFSEFNNIDLAEFDENILDLKEELEESLSRIRRGYRSSNNLRKLNTLSISIVFYIVNLYELIYQESENELVESKEYKAFKQKKDLMDTLKNTIKVFENKQRGETLEWDFNATEIGKNLLSIILDLM